jgi:hypothetical protein
MNLNPAIRRNLHLVPLLGASAAAVALCIIATDAGAQGAEVKTRGEVKAETRTAIARGEMPSTGTATAPEKEARTPKSTTSRASVKADTRTALASGERMPAEGRPTEKLPRTTMQARADVKAEAKAANKAGQTRAGETYPDRKP